LRRHPITAPAARDGYRRALAPLALAMSVCIASPAHAQTTEDVPRNGHDAPIRGALSRYAEAGELTTKHSTRASQSRPPKRRSFAKRHPVWTGVLVGGGTGTAVAAGAWGNEGAFVGLYTGAAAGALVGWLASH